MKHENILLKSALALAIVDLVLIAAILLQVNNLVKDVLEVQNKQIEIGVMKERQNNLDAKLVDVDFDEGQWQTYKNEEFGFEIKYPKAWEVNKIDELPKNQIAAFSIDDPASPLQFYKYNIPDCDNILSKCVIKVNNCVISIYENKSNLSLKDWIDGSGIYSQPGPEGYIIEKAETVNINNMSAQKIYGVGSNAARGISIYVPSNNKIFGIIHPAEVGGENALASLKYNSICEKIAGTYFKFTD